MNKWILILGVIFMFLLYRQNPEIVIFGAVAFITWKLLSGFGKGKNANPELLAQQATNLEMRRINEGINRLVTQISLLNMQAKKDLEDMVDDVETFDHYEPNV